MGIWHFLYIIASPNPSRHAKTHPKSANASKLEGFNYPSEGYICQLHATGLTHLPIQAGILTNT